MSGDDWQVGDLALCIKGGRCSRAGETYSVIAVTAPLEIDPWGFVNLTNELLLEFAEFNPFAADGFAASRFRKIKPDSHEPCEEEFRILLQLSKKRVSA